NRTAFPELAGLARDLGIQDRVVFLGQVPEEDKAPLYSACTVFVFPSLYEGFGLTPLEAMACGAPVVCSRASSLPEVVGEAAVLFDPTDVEEMARALTKTLTDRSLRERMRQAGLEQAGKFSWRRTAEETLEAYRQVTGGVAGLRAGHVLGAAGLPAEAGAGPAVTPNYEILTDKRALRSGGGIPPPPPGGQGRPPLRLSFPSLLRWVRESSIGRSGRPPCRPGASSGTQVFLHESSAGKPGSRSTTCVVCPTGPSRIWGDQRLSRWNTALRRARREASDLRGRVLEVGCGAGRFTRALKEGSPGAVFVGCDIDPVSLSVGKSYCDGVRYAAADLHVLPFLDGSFRAVMLFDVLEHLQEPGLALSELYRVLEPEGILHALVPCEGQPGSLHWLLWRLRLGGDLKERHSGHIQRFTQRDVLRLLGATGFRVERVTYSIHPMGQVRDILSYLEQEAWFERWHLGNPLFRLIMRLLWAASYLESNLLFKHIPIGAVALHVTARRKREP
ncbi:MAG: glycosyltransferase, partial [Dehalococcoidia bacterium]|nr:glycosyltransferase [Dehalococcoidia bacterium]